MEDDPKSGRPTTSRTNENVEHVREKVRSDRHLNMIALYCSSFWDNLFSKYFFLFFLLLL